MHDIRYDAVHDEFFVTNPFAQAILTFRGSASGEEPPIRIIQGSNTQLSDGVDRLDVDTLHNEIFVPALNSILVFPRDAQGNVAPIRIIRGPETHLRSAMVLAVDPANNLIVSNARANPDGAVSGDEIAERAEALLIFNRTDQGNVAPRAVIAGPKTGLVSVSQLQVYSPKGWIIGAIAGVYRNTQEPEGTFVGGWSIHDNGDASPRWKISGTKSTLKRPRGVVLIPQYKELVVADMRLNSVLTFYFPEIF